MLKKVFGRYPPLLIILLAVLQSCENKTKTVGKVKIEDSFVQKSDTAQDNLKTFKSNIRPDELLTLEKIYTDTVEFVNFDANGDDWFFNVKKNKDTVSLIYNEDPPRLTRGDELEIKWKMDSLRPAGDPDFLDYSEYLISAKVIKPLKLTDKKVKFLWREFLYDKEFSKEINTIILNKNYIKSISEPEKAALAYTATFIGNGCGWDGKADGSTGNLKCKILTALDLGYQCSVQHLGFLRDWFRNDHKILKELENCTTTPDGATVQDTFDEIHLHITGNKITVFFKPPELICVMVNPGTGLKYTASYLKKINCF